MDKSLTYVRLFSHKYLCWDLNMWKRIEGITMKIDLRRSSCIMPKMWMGEPLKPHQSQVGWKGNFSSLKHVRVIITFVWYNLVIGAKNQLSNICQKKNSSGCHDRYSDKVSLIYFCYSFKRNNFLDYWKRLRIHISPLWNCQKTLS